MTDEAMKEREAIVYAAGAKDAERAIVDWLRNSAPHKITTVRKVPAVPPEYDSDGDFICMGLPERMVKAVRYTAPKELADAIERGDHHKGTDREG